MVLVFFLIFAFENLSIAITNNVYNKYDEIKITCTLADDYRHACDGQQVSVNSKGISLILDVENGKPAQYLYFGFKLNAADLQNLTGGYQRMNGCLILRILGPEYSCRSCTRHASQRW